MAIVPQVNLTVTSNQRNLNSSDKSSSLASHDHLRTSESNINDEFIYNLHQFVIESATNAILDLDPVDCIDGNCPTVEIPTILILQDITKKTQENLGITVADLDIEAAYEYIMNTYTRLNNMLQMPSADSYEDNPEAYYIVGKNYEYQHKKTSNVAFGKTSYYVDNEHLGYYTGAQIFDEDLGDFVDEFVSFASIRELFPNVKFVFPTKIRTSYLKYLYNNKFHIDDLYNFLDVFPPTEFENEFLYFPDNTPGLIVAETDLHDDNYYQASHILEAAVNAQALSKFSVKRFTARFGNITVPGVYHQYAFKQALFVTLANEDYTTERAQAHNVGTAYGSGVTTTGPFKMGFTIALHEYIHTAANADHDFTLPTMAKGFFSSPDVTDRPYSTGIMTYPTSASDAAIDDDATTRKLQGAGDLVNYNVLNNPIKPPFNFTYKNRRYPSIKRDFDKAVSDLNKFNEEYPTIPDSLYKSSSKSVKEIHDNLIDRKNLIEATLLNTPEFYTGSFSDDDQDLYTFIESFINIYIPRLTNNFTNNCVFQEGNTVPAQILSPATQRKTPHENSTSHNFWDHQAFKIYQGLSKFWGGAFVLNNPPELGSDYLDIEDNTNRLVVNIKEQQYASIIKFQSEKLQYSEIVEVLQNNPGWRIPSLDEAVNIVDSVASRVEKDRGQTFVNSVAFSLYFLDNLNLSISSSYFSGFLCAHADESKLNYFTTAHKVKTSTNSKSDLLQSNSTYNLILVKDIDLLEDDTISTSFVLNPTKDDGTRKGPNVTSYIPFCKPGNLDIYDPTWALNFNSYNPKYPEYPSNTKLKDAFNEEFCPCLYKEQTYRDNNNEIKSYTVIEPDGKFLSLKALYTPQGNFLKNSISGGSGTNATLKMHAKKFYEEFHLYIEHYINKNYSTPKTLKYLNLINKPSTSNGLSAPIYYRYSDPEQTYLEAIPAIGYFGFGYKTPIPFAYQVNPKIANEHLVFKNFRDQEVFNNTPEEAFVHMRLAYHSVSTDLRFDHNSLDAYKMFSSENNPYKDKFSTDKDAIVNNMFDYYTHHDGDFSILGRHAVMQYADVNSVLVTKVPRSSFTKGINYIANSNSTMAMVRRAIVNDSKLDTTSPKIAVGKTVILNGEKHQIFKVSNVKRPIPSGPQQNLNAYEVVAINIERVIYGSLHDIWSTEYGNHATYNTDADHDYFSLGIEFDEFHSHGISSTTLKDAIEDGNLDFTSMSWATDTRNKHNIPLNLSTVTSANGNTKLRITRLDPDYSTTPPSVGSANTIVVTFGATPVPEDLEEALIVFKDYPHKNPPIKNFKGLIVRKFYVQQEDKTGLTKYYIQDAFDKVSTDIQNFDYGNAVGGCKDSSAFNYNKDATYDDGSCVEKVFGCIKDWADNYNEHANVDDGSCMAEVCLDSLASGEYGFGYDESLISTITEYNPDSLVEAPTIIAVSKNAIDESKGASICQQLFEPRKAIGKFICTNIKSGVGDPLGIAHCDQTIDMLIDKTTYSPFEYTSNPERVTKNLSALLNAGITYNTPDHHLVSSTNKKLIVLGAGYAPNRSLMYLGGFGYPILNSDNTLNKDFDTSSIDNSYLANHLKVIENEILKAESGANLVNTIKYRLKYNCPENPILPDGSGGCILMTFEGSYGAPLTYKLQGCNYPSFTTLTPSDCFNTKFFEGGYLPYTLSLPNQYKGIEGSCKESDKKYLISIPTSIETDSEGVEKTIYRAAIVTEDTLPIYSVGQMSKEGGYDSELLLPHLIPFDTRVEAIEAGGQIEYNESSMPTGTTLEVFIEGVLFDDVGISYIGKYTYTIYNDNTIQYFKYSDEGDVGHRLYSYEDVVNGKDGVTFAPGELDTYAERIKKLDEIANEIEKLTIFTD